MVKGSATSWQQVPEGDRDSLNHHVNQINATCLAESFGISPLGAGILPDHDDHTATVILIDGPPASLLRPQVLNGDTYLTHRVAKAQ